MSVVHRAESLVKRIDKGMAESEVLIRAVEEEDRVVLVNFVACHFTSVVLSFGGGLTEACENN